MYTRYTTPLTPRRTVRFRRAGLLALFLLTALAPARAATCIWDGSTASWTEAAHWSCGRIPTASDDIVVNGGTVTIDVAVTIQAFAFNGGVIAGTGAVTVNGPLVWAAGTMEGTGTTTIKGGLTFNTAVSKTISRTVVLDSDGQWTDGNINMRDGAVFRLLAGHTFADSAVGSHSIARVSVTATEPVVENAGTWRVTTTQGSAYNIQFRNTGALEVTTPVSFKVNAPGTLDNTGTLRGTSLIDTASGATVVLAGATAPGSDGVNPARLSFRGDFPMANSHALRVDLDGAATAGIDYDQLAVADGDVTVAGKLYVAVHYDAVLGQQFDLLTRTGTGTLTGCYEEDDIIVTPSNYAIEVVCTNSGLVGTVTSTSVANEHLPTPSVGVLSAASPNPFRTRTMLTLSVAEAQRVAVEVFDVTGRKVAVLFEGLASRQPLPLALEGTALPSGLYLVRATGERFLQTQRVTLSR